MSHRSFHPDLRKVSASSNMVFMATTTTKQTKPTYIAICPHYWGRGSTVDEAKRNLKAVGGTLTRYVVYVLPPGAINVTVDKVRGDILWDWEEGADTSLHAEVVAKRGVK